MCESECLCVSNLQVHRPAPDGKESISPGPWRKGERQKKGLGEVVSDANGLPCSSQKLPPVAQLVKYRTLWLHSRDTHTKQGL